MPESCDVEKGSIASGLKLPDCGVAEQSSGRDGGEGEIDMAIRAIRDMVVTLGSSGFDGKVIAVALSAAATHEMLSAFGKEQAASLAAQMYSRSYLS